MKEEKEFIQWQNLGGKIYGIGNTQEQLKGGFYEPSYDDRNNPCLKSIEVEMPELFVLQDETHDKILNDIENFWGNEERYRKFNSIYKRNILLYSVPGNGKTSLINIIARRLIERYNGVVMMINKVHNLYSYGEMMQQLKEIEPSRKVIVVIEDFENLANNPDASSTLLQMLDGNLQFDNVITIATTNTPSMLGSRYVARPSRFNLVIEHKKPNEKARRDYIGKKLASGGIDIETEQTKADIERIVEKTENYTFDFLKEAVQAIYVDGIPEDNVFKRLNDTIATGANIKLTDDFSNPIGLKPNYLEDYGIEKDITPSTMPNYGNKCISRSAKKISRISPLGR